MSVKTIKSEKDYEKAMARVDELFEARLSAAEADELDRLVTLVDAYEEKAYPIDLPDPIGAIRYRMSHQGLTPKDLIPYIGSASKVSEVLSGKRNLSINMIRNLVEGLGIPAEVLLRKRGAKLPAKIVPARSSAKSPARALAKP